MSKRSLYISILLALLLVACGKQGNDHKSGDGDNSLQDPQPTEPADPAEVAVGTTQTVTLSESVSFLSLPGIGDVIFAVEDASKSPIVSIKKAATPESKTAFGSVREELLIQEGSDYEVVLTSSLLPEKEVEIDLTVPKDLRSKVNEGNALAVYIEMDEDEDNPRRYFPIESFSYDENDWLQISLPSWAFKLNENVFKFEAVIKIGLASSFNEIASDASTTSYVALRSIELPSRGPEVNSDLQTKLDCPIATTQGCIETSRFGPRKGGKSHHHSGADFRAKTPLDVKSSVTGEVLRIVPDWGMVSISNGKEVIVYTHLSVIDVKVNETVSEGQVIGKTGDKYATDRPHLHMELVRPSQRIGLCGSNVEDIACVTYIMAPIDPYPQLVSSVSLRRSSTSSTVNAGETFNLILEGKDSKGAIVTTEINNQNPKFIEGIRKVNWHIENDSTAVTVDYAEKYSGSNPEIGHDPRKRNEGTVTVNREEVTAILAAWDGVPVQAEYSVGIGDCRFIGIRLTDNRSFVPVTENCPSFTFSGIHSGHSQWQNGEILEWEPPVVYEYPYERSDMKFWGDQAEQIATHIFTFTGGSYLRGAERVRISLSATVTAVFNNFGDACGGYLYCQNSGTWSGPIVN